jgi:acyl-CoA thioester hydrolase
MFPLTYRTQYRVIYGDTDQMGVVYYGNYGRLYEMGRAEMIRSLGFSYAELEKRGIAMPVYTVEAKYRNVLRYDELITIETTLKEAPKARMEFFHRIFSEAGELAHEARVVLVFQDMHSNKLVRAPQILLEVFSKHRQS